MLLDPIFQNAGDLSIHQNAYNWLNGVTYMVGALHVNPEDFVTARLAQIHVV